MSRKTGADVWEFRFRNHAEPGSPMRQMTLSTLEYPTETQTRIALQSKVMRLNGPTRYKQEERPTFGLVIDRFVEVERLEAIVALMRHAQVSTTMNIYGSGAMKSKREANSKVVQMLMKHDAQNPQSASAA